MTHSSNEISKLAEKAAIGAGFPTAQAELFGRAAAQHLAAGKSGAPIEAALIDTNDSIILRLPLLLDDVMRLARLMPGPLELTLHPGDEELAPAYARLLPLPLARHDVRRRVDAQSRLVLEFDAAAPGDHRLPTRITPQKPLLDKLARLAARTYVPSSDDGRLRGAGAGLTDND